MAQQSEKFEAIVKHLQKLNESENTVKQKLTAVSKVSMPAIQVQPKMTPEVDGASSVIESPGVKDKSEEYLKKSEEWLKGIDKTLKNIQDSFAKNISSSSKSEDISGKSEGTGKLPGLPKEYTLTEGLKSTVGMAKSIGKGIAGFASNPTASLSKTFGSVKDTVKGALGSAKDILNAEAGYTPERERFAKGYAASAKGTQFQKGRKSALDAGKDKYDALKSKEDEINTIKEKMDVPASQGFSPLKKDQKELDKLNKDFNELDPRINTVKPDNKKDTKVDIQDAPDVDKSPNEKITAASVNPESDNIETSGELISKEIRETNDLIGQNLAIVKAQLEEFKNIRIALTPATPDDPNKDPNKRVVEKLDELIEAVKEGGGSGSGGGLGLTDLIPGGGKIAAGGKLASKMAGLGKAAKIGGAALAIGAGAYTAYKGWTGAEDNKQAKLEAVQAKVDAGEMKPEEAAAARKEIGNTATVEKSGAVGEGTGLAAGAIAGGMAGAKLGATIGTFVGGPLGTAVGAGIGGLAGGALGAFAGSSAGKYVGEKAGEGINAVKSFFGGSKSDTPAAGKAAAVAMGAAAPAAAATKTSGDDRASHIKKVRQEAGNEALKAITSAIEGGKDPKAQGELSSIGSEAIGKYGTNQGGELSLQTIDSIGKTAALQALSNSEKKKSGPAAEKSDDLQAQRDKIAAAGPATGSVQSSMAHKRVLGALDKAIEDKKSKPSEGKSVDVLAKEEAKKFGRDTPTSDDVDAAEMKSSASLGEKVRSEAKRLGIEPNKAKGVFEGGVLTKMVDTSTGKEHNIEVSEKDKRNVTAARDMRAMNENSGNLAATASRNVGNDVVKASTENADLNRDTSRSNNNITPVVSTNVSTNNNTSYVPVKPTPRNEKGGSALDRYQDRVSSF